jgi:hypothetical protein
MRQPRAHAELGHHPAGNVGSSLQVILGARGCFAEYDLFGRHATQEHGEAGLQFRLSEQFAVVLGQLQHVTEGSHARAG